MMAPRAWFPRAASRVAAVVLAGFAAGGPALSEAGPDARPAERHAVKVERVRPKREKLETLRFLKANRDFFRARLDELRASPEEGRESAEVVDERFVTLRSLFDQASAAQDSFALDEALLEAQDLMRSVTELAALEAQLDRLEGLLGEQGGRLDRIESDFVGRQETALLIVVKGYPRHGEIEEVVVREEDGRAARSALSPDTRDALKTGGVIQVSHELVEPREQVLSLAFSGEHWSLADTAFLSLQPERDRINFLEIDLSTLSGGEPLTRLDASTWFDPAAGRAPAPPK
jgi:hypothetical protein